MRRIVARCSTAFQHLAANDALVRRAVDLVQSTERRQTTEGPQVPRGSQIRVTLRDNARDHLCDSQQRRDG